MRLRHVIAVVGALTALSVATLLVTVLVTGATSAAGPNDGNRRRAAPIIISHRGASGHTPEHTLEAYRLAIAMGADYIEPDLVSTKDGALVARHENELSASTDISRHREFADRRRTKVVDGIWRRGWFTEDFTLAELKTLRAFESMPKVRPGNTDADGRYQIPTLQEIIDLVRAESKRTGRLIGLYPETKHPSYFASLDLALEPPLVATLRKNKLVYPWSRVFVQSFETANLRKLNEMIDVPLVQLVDLRGEPYDQVLAGKARSFRSLVRPAGLRTIASYADVIGVHKYFVRAWDNRNATMRPPTSLVADAHAAGLRVHVWTFRNENVFLPVSLRRGKDPTGFGDALAEYRMYFDLGVDGVFSDYPETAYAARASR